MQTDTVTKQANTQAIYPFKRNILSLFAAVLVLLLGTFSLSAIWWEKNNFNDSLARQQISAGLNYQSAVEQEADMLSATLDTIKLNETIKQAFATGNRDTLLHATQPLFEILKRDHNITHFYFITPERINLLRVHQPARYGDLINRHTLRSAQSQHALAYGVEIGPIGTLTLRAVTPWFDGGHLLGYVELGKEIENVARDIKPALHADVTVLLDKSRLNRHDWEEGMRMLGRQPDWEQFPDSVLITSTMSHIPDVAKNYIKGWRGNSTGQSQQIADGTNGTRLGMTSSPILDAASNQVGVLLVIEDVTLTSQTMHRHLLYLVAACLLLGAALFEVFRRILGRVEISLHEAETTRQNAQQYEHTMHHLSAVVNCMGDGLLVIDGEGIITHANRSFTDLFNFDESIVGLSCRDLPAEDLAALVERTLHHAEHFPVSSQISLPGHRTANAIAALLDSRGAGSHEGGAVFTFRDITRELEISRMKTDFIANVSHELRTPLTSVLGFAKLIRKQFSQHILPALNEPTEKTAKAATRIAENLEIIILEGERLTNLINDVLDLTKIEAGKVEWRDEPVVAADLIQRAIAASSSLFEQKALPLLTEIPDDLPVLRGDPDRLMQVIINLLSNAAKFTLHGSVVCGAKRIEQGVAIYVRDNGIGISPADQLQLFERFRQVGDTLTDKPKGTGLGLAICKQIVKHHGGTIKVESTPGTGSTFTMLLPLPDTALIHESEVVRLRDYILPGDINTTSGYTVLVVDDEANIRELLRQELEAAGYSVREAVDGFDAISQARTNPPDLIVMDVMMPGISGFDAVSVLRGAPETSSIPLIILSIIDDKQRGKQLGVDGYLTKPVHIEELIGSIDNLLKQRETHKKLIVVDSDEAAITTLRDVLLARGYAIDHTSAKITSLQQAREDGPHTVIVTGQRSLSGHVISSLQMTRNQERVLLLITTSEQA
ncbi:MAG: ATP-binding protein [Gallionella sp.]|jgi:signal transduction histidine kinase/DNA-binding response OmpR family regulator